MADLIRREDVIKLILKYQGRATGENLNLLVQLWEELNMLPSVTSMQESVEPTQKSVNNTLETRCKGETE